MARWKPAPVIGGAYSDDAKPWTCQDTVNYIPVMAERPGGRSPAMLRGVPGMVTFCNLGTGKPIRGARNVEGALLVVSGTGLYQVATSGAATLIGTIPGVGRVSMSHNQITGGNEVAIANGQSGYVYNTVTGTLAQITDEGFPGAISFDFIDGFITGIEPARRFAFHSNLAAATGYNTLDRYEAEGSPDKLVGQIVDHREWWLFSERTIEPFVNTGAATNTFRRASNTMIEVGCASGASIAQMDSSVFWIGNDGIVYRANGYTPQRISTHAIEQALAKCNLSQCFAVTFEDEGHKIYYLTCPDGQTWGYDASSGEWHRRQSEGLSRWRINTLTKWNGYWIAGDYTNGKLYVLDWKIQHEAGAVLERRRITGVLHDNQNRVTVDGVALVFDTGLSGDVYSPLVPPLKIAGLLPQGIVNEAADFTYATSGGVLPRIVSIQSGALPTDLSVDAAGHVTGGYTAYGTFSWVAQVIDADNTVATIAQTMMVSASVIADVNFDAGSLTYDKTGRTWTIDSATIYDRWGLQPVVMPAVVASPSVSGMAMSKTPDTKVHDGTFDYPGRENLGIRSLLGAGAIGQNIDFCIELDVRLNINHETSNNLESFLGFYSSFGKFTFGARVFTNAPMENQAPGVTRTLWAPPNVTPGTFFHVAVTRAGDRLSCWYNGVKYAEYTGASAMTVRSTDSIIVGHSDGSIGSSLGWAGQFDNIRVTLGWARYV